MKNPFQSSTYRSGFAARRRWHFVRVSVCLGIVGWVLGGSYKINSLGSWGISTKAFKIWRGGKCSVVVPPTLHVIIS